MLLRTAHLALLGAVAAMLVLPQHRALFLDHLHTLLTRRPPPWLNPAGVREERARLSRFDRVVEADPENLSIHLGRVLLGAPAFAGPASTAGLDRQLTSLERVRRRFPNDPRPVAHLLRYECRDRLRIRRKDRPGSHVSEVDRLLPPEALARIETLVAVGRRLDSGNGYFDTLLAVGRAAARRDRGMLDAIREAARRPDWRDYAFEEGQGALQLLVAAYGDRGLWSHVYPTTAVRLPHTAQIRHTARLALRQAVRDGESGDLRREHEIRRDVAALGLRMSRADNLNCRLVGRSVAHMALSPDGVPPPYRRGAVDQTADRAVYLARLAREAPDLLPEAEQAAAAVEKLQSLRFPEFDPPGLIDRACGREVLGVSLLANLFAMALLLAGAAAVERAVHPYPRLRDPYGDSGGEGSFESWVPAACALAVASGLALLVKDVDAVRELGAYWGTTGMAIWQYDLSAQPIHWLPGLLVTGSLLAGLVVLSGLIAAVRTRASVLGAAAGLRRTAGAAAGALLLSYVFYALYTVPALHRDARGVQRVISQM